MRTQYSNPCIITRPISGQLPLGGLTPCLRAGVLSLTHLLSAPYWLYNSSTTVIDIILPIIMIELFNSPNHVNNVIKVGV